MATVVIIISIAYLIRNQAVFRPGLDVRPFAALGEVVGQQTSQLLGGNGHVVVLTRAHDAVGKTRNSAFGKALSKTGHATITATEVLPANDESSAFDGFTSAGYFELIRTHATADVIVSFAGYPILTAVDYGNLPGKKPKLVVIVLNEANLLDLKRLFAEGVVQLAIIPRTQNKLASPSHDPANKEFDKYFQLVTPAEAGSLLD